MEEQFLAFLTQVKPQMREQTKEILSSIDGKLEPLIKETKKLVLENEQMRKKIAKLEQSNRKNNIIIFGVEEKRKNNLELLEVVTKIFRHDSEESTILKSDIDTIYRLGRKDIKNNKPKPIKMSLLNNWKREQVMENKKLYENVYLTEDYPKEVMDKRKSLQHQMQEERKKGNFAIIKYDQLIIKENGSKQEKRKRDLTKTPENKDHQRKEHITNPAKTSRTNAFDVLRGRSNSSSDITITSKLQ